jgi:hypothetical protein
MPITSLSEAQLQATAVCSLFDPIRLDLVEGVARLTFERAIRARHTGEIKGPAVLRARYVRRGQSSGLASPRTRSTGPALPMEPPSLAAPMSSCRSMRWCNHTGRTALICRKGLLPVKTRFEAVVELLSPDQASMWTRIEQARMLHEEHRVRHAYFDEDKYSVRPRSQRFRPHAATFSKVLL